MKKYSTKKHLSLDICQNENWAKYNHKQNRTYRNVPANWREKLAELSAEQKSELFFKYALEGNKKMLKAIYTADGEPLNINAKDRDNNNALMFAIKSGDRDTVEYLLSIGIETDYINTIGFSPMHLAVRKNNLNLVALLVDNNADINIQDKLGRTPIFDAVCENNGKMINALAINGISVDTTDNHGTTPLMIAVEDQSRQESFIALINLGADVNAKDNNGKNALIRAIEHDNNAMMDMLFKSGIDIDATDRNFMTAVHHCAKMGNREALRILISKGADIFGFDRKGRRAVDIANQYKNFGCAQILEKAEKIYSNPNLTESQRVDALREFGRHNKVINSCVR